MKGWVRRAASIGACLGLALAGPAAGVEIVDQENLPPDDGNFNIDTFSQLGQEFVPDFSELVSVVLFLFDSNSGQPSNNITLNVRDGDIMGDILGTKTLSPFPLAGGLEGPVSFDFDSSIFLTPGETYVLEVLADSNRGSWQYTDNDAYADGQIYLLGVLSNGFPEVDFAFQTIANVPEPATAAMLGLGLLVLAKRRRA